MKIRGEGTGRGPQSNTSECATFEGEPELLPAVNTVAIAANCI